MSQANVQTVRSLYEAWNGPDGGRAALPFIADDFEFVNPSYAVEPGTRYGHQGWLAAIESLEAAFHSHLESTAGASGSGRSGAVLHHVHREDDRGRAAFTQDETHLWTLRGGKVIRLEWFHDRREGLEAAGLSE